jgi:heme exporter protein D
MGDGVSERHRQAAGMLAYDYPLLSIFWSILWFAILIGWIMALFAVIIDIFRSHDMGGFAKAIWLVFVIVLPLLGVLIYLVARGGKMAEHSIADAQERDAAMQAYVRDAAAPASPADELVKLAALRDAGTLSEAEFQAAKSKLI